MIKILEENPRYLVDSNGFILDTKYNNRPICMWVDNTGYYQCNLYFEDGTKKYVRVHSLVAKTFIPNPYNLPQVDHKDGNKLNNAVYNLEWVTNAENTQRGYDNGAYHFPHLNSYPIKLYRDGEYISTYKSIRTLCKYNGFNRKTVSAILNGTKKNTDYYNCTFEYATEGQTTIEMVRIIDPE